jgi:hypothetical protein
MEIFLERIIRKIVETPKNLIKHFFEKVFKIKEHESRLSEQESPLRRGSGINTSGICCRKHKARVTVVSPSYKEIFGRG